jgi:hypothetical protein
VGVLLSVVLVVLTHPWTWHYLMPNIWLYLVAIVAVIVLNKVRRKRKHANGLGFGASSCGRTFVGRVEAGPQQGVTRSGTPPWRQGLCRLLVAQCGRAASGLLRRGVVACLMKSAGRPRPPPYQSGSRRV